MPGPNAATPPGPSLPARTIVAPTLTPPRPLLIGDHWDITRTPGFLLKGETDVFLGKGRTLFFFLCLVSYPHLFRTRQQLNKYYIEEAAAKNQRNKGTEEGEWSYQISNSAVRSDFDFFGLFFPSSLDSSTLSLKKQWNGRSSLFFSFFTLLSRFSFESNQWINEALIQSNASVWPGSVPPRTHRFENHLHFIEDLSIYLIIKI